MCVCMCSCGRGWFQEDSPAPPQKSESACTLVLNCIINIDRCLFWNVTQCLNLPGRHWASWFFLVNGVFFRLLGSWCCTFTDRQMLHVVEMNRGWCIFRSSWPLCSWSCSYQTWNIILFCVIQVQCDWPLCVFSPFSLLMLPFLCVCFPQYQAVLPASLLCADSRDHDHLRWEGAQSNYLFSLKRTGGALCCHLGCRLSAGWFLTVWLPGPPEVCLLEGSKKRVNLSILTQPIEHE